MARNIDELRKLNKEELIEKKLSDLQELKKVKFKLKSGDITADNINKARKLKLEIARISTILNELKLVENTNDK